MASKTVNAAEIAGIFETAMCEMPDGNHVKKGDIVICSVNGNYSDPCRLGVVLMVKNVKLPANHGDGPRGEVFVLPFDKQKLRGGHTLRNLKSYLLLLHCFFFSDCCCAFGFCFWVFC